MIYIRMDAGFYCPRITKGISFRFDGKYSLCCVMDDEHYSLSLGDTSSGISASETMFEDFMSSSWRQGIIDTASKGDWPVQCLSCKRYEDQGIKSHRQSILQKNNKHLHVQIGNVCDSDCVMCGPAWSSKIRARLAKSPDPSSIFLGRSDAPIRNIWDDSKLLDNLKQAISWADHVHFGGGEPLLDPRMWNFLESIANERLILSVITNLNTLPHDRIGVFKRFKSVEIYASIDGTGETYEWIRQGLSWDRLRNNIKNLRHIDKVQVSVATDVQAYTISNLPSLQSWCLAEGLDIEYNLIKMPWLLQAKHAPISVLTAALHALPDGTPQHLRDMLQSALDTHDSSAMEKLRTHTTYLNSHRTHRFDIDEWRVIPQK